MRRRCAVTGCCIIATLSILVVFRGSAPAEDGCAAVSAWADSLPFDDRATAGIERYAIETGVRFVDGYAFRLAGGIRRLIGEAVERQLEELSTGARRPFVEVVILDPGFACGGDMPLEGKAEREFERSFVRTEVLAFFGPESIPPDTALDVFDDGDFRKAVSSRFESIRHEGQEVCIEVGGVRFLLEPLEYCDLIAELHRENIAAQHAQTVRNTGGRDHQTVYFKESLKTFVRLPDGLAFHYINYSRSIGMAGITRGVVRGRIESSERKAVEELERRVAAARR